MSNQMVDGWMNGCTNRSLWYISFYVYIICICCVGVIYLRCCTSGSGRSFLEDPPSISEGCGGRVTDYRINVCIDIGLSLCSSSFLSCS